MWPFAKLLNGFSSHMYVYSPTLLDSQVLSSQRCKKNYVSFIHHSSQLEMLLSTVTTIVPQPLPFCQWRMEMENLPWLHVTLHQDLRFRDAPEHARFLADGEARHHRLLHQLREDYLLERLGFCGDGGNGEWRR